jgi:hypothetical protein
MCTVPPSGKPRRSALVAHSPAPISFLPTTTAFSPDAIRHGSRHWWGGPKDGSSTLHEGERASKWHASLLCLTVWSRREGAKYTTKPSSLYRRINASWGIGHGWLRLGIGTDGGAPKSIAPESAPSMPHESIVGESAMTAPGDRERWWCIKRRQ